MPENMVSINIPLIVKMPRTEFEAWARREGVNLRDARRNIRNYVVTANQGLPMIEEAGATVDLGRLPA